MYHVTLDVALLRVSPGRLPRPLVERRQLPSAVPERARGVFPIVPSDAPPVEFLRRGASRDLCII